MRLHDHDGDFGALADLGPEGYTALLVGPRLLGTGQERLPHDARLKLYGPTFALQALVHLKHIYISY